MTSQKPIAEDFGAIAAKLKELEAEKARAITQPLPDVQPIYDLYGCDYLGPDYDPA